MKRDFRKLRTKFDGNDSFMTGGHQIIKSAGATLHADRMAKVPVWAMHDGKIRELLLRSFPKLATNETQRSKAARWARVIQLYYRVGWTRNKIADELGMSLGALTSLLRSIKRASEGRRANGSGQLGMAPVGRPKSVPL
jgi:hypothetical protein